jgi:PAS domain S-box-containing protein
MLEPTERVRVPVSLFAHLQSHFGQRISLLDCTKATLVHISHTLEDVVLRHQLPAIMLTGFQESSHWREETERYRALADVAQQICIFAGGTLPPESNEREIRVTLEGDDPLRQEWFLCVLSPQFSALLCGQDYEQTTTSESTRTFATFWTFEPQLINEAIELLIGVVEQYRPDRVEALQSARRQFPLTAPDPYLMTFFTRELIRFEERLHSTLSERESQYRAISNLTADYVYALDIEPSQNIRARWVTDAFTRITGYTSAELEELGGWPVLIHPDDTLVVQSRAARVLAGKHDTSEFRIKTKSNEVRWLRDYAHPEWDTLENRVVSILGAAQDITERKAAEQERLMIERKLLDTQKLESLGVLAGGIAHDFNNLLVTIVGNAGLALLDMPMESPAVESLRHIEIAAQRAADLTRQLLAYAGKGKIVVQEVNINSLVTEMIQLLQAAIAKNVVLRLNLAPTLPLIQADPTQMRQVIMNLVINAAEAIGTRSGIVSMTTGVQWADTDYFVDTSQVSTLPEGNYVYLEVADTGSGMDAQTRARIFEPFFTTKFTGRGLGLSAVLGIIRGHNGALKLYSEPGQGSTFKVLFPSAETIATPQQGVRETIGKWRSHGTVLVVDDEAEVRATVTRMLERWGFTVLAADDGHSALDTFAAHAADIVCVLLDLTMPHLGGADTFRQLRRLNAKIGVIVMSGYNEQEVSSLFAGKGVGDFLQKPFTPVELQIKLKQLLGE